ncbi:recombinase family protein [Micromonospora sp. NPDC049679]|uniref:recombinase family protein n=1 Tax=Micromonospora sp. NPDC049679 TaxID=3155920 RepID=UPI0033D2A1A4
MTTDRKFTRHRTTPPAFDDQPLRFAFYGRVSTEDQQDPEASRAWQLSRSRALIEPVGGQVVAEFFDIGLSRSLPWKRRPEASRLLAALRDPRRGFDAVVIGEPQRAFYGNQFGLTFPLFEHYGVALWVPEVGGAVDPGSDAHDLVMALYGGMSKGERNRIKVRVRSAMAAQAATEGRFLGGRPPYGYRLVDAGPHPNPSKAADGRRLHRLEPDPLTAPFVRRIYAEYLAGNGIFAIAEGLTRDGVLSPSAYDRRRNPHRTTTAWSKSAIRVILTNPRYTGRQVWNKQRKTEILIDDVALGHETKLRWNPTHEWIYSGGLAHEPLIDDETFARVQTLIASAGRRPDGVMKPRASKRNYVLSGLLRCGICQRRMTGSFNNDRNHYRCTYAAEYTDANRIAHPRSVYVREDHILEQLHPWLARAFSPSRLTTTVQAMADAQHDDVDQQAIKAARETLATCATRLDRYRAALDSGADPTVVSRWIADVQAEQLTAEAALRRLTGRRTMSPDEIRRIVEALGNITTVLRDADPGDKALIYRELGLTLTYRPTARTVSAQATPNGSCTRLCPRGDLNPHALYGH